MPMIVVVVVLAFVVVGCGGGSSPDAGAPDAARADAGRLDAGRDDAGRDAGSADAGIDASASDAGVDAGGAEDAGMPCVPPDRDGDGHDAIACGGDDCDDGDPDVNPDAIDGPDRTWTVIDGVPGSEGQELAAVLDDAGDAHVAYHWSNVGRTDEGLRYLRLTPSDTVAVVEEAHRSTDALRSRVGRDAAIAVDAARVPHVSFIDQRTTGSITFFTGSRAGGAWSFESPAGGDQDTAIAVTSSGARHIAVSGVTYLTNAGGTFTSEPIATGRSPRVAHDSTGTVHVVYAAPDGIRHAVRGAAGWTITNIQDFSTAPAILHGIAMSLDASDTLHVAYGTGTELVYARRPAGGAWSREMVTTTTSNPQSIAVLADGRVAIAFIEWLSSGGYTIRFAFSSPSGWLVVDDTSACGCYDVELLERNGRMSLFYAPGGNLALGTFVPPDGVDDDCDGTAW